MHRTGGRHCRKGADGAREAGRDQRTDHSQGERAAVTGRKGYPRSHLKWEERPSQQPCPLSFSKCDGKPAA